MANTPSRTKLDSSALAERLRRLLGGERVVAGNDVAILGMVAPLQAWPADAEQLASLLVLAGSERLGVCVAGGATRLAWGNRPDRFDLLLSTRDLCPACAVEADDLTMTVGAGVTLAEARSQARAVNRVFPLDSGYPSLTTAGGVAATGEQGAREPAYGRVRDLVLGLRATLADGTPVAFGGRTMKNVAGYDMTKLFLGSFGVLGVITEVTFRLLPRPDSQVLVAIGLPSLERAKELATRIMHSSLLPSLLEVLSTGMAACLEAAVPAHDLAALHRPDEPLLLAGFAGHPAALARSVADVGAWSKGCPQAVLRDAEAEEVFAKLADLNATQVGARESITHEQVALAARAAVPISKIWDLAQTAESLATSAGLPLVYRIGATRGTIDLWFEGILQGQPANAPLVSWVEHVRSLAAASGGRLTLTGGSELPLASLDAWGDPGPAVKLMRRLKERFDPEGTLNPGRFLGGDLVSARERESPDRDIAPQSAGGGYKPPEEFRELYAEVLTCSKCGLCQPACPVFRATGKEANVARGKVTLYRDITEGGLELTPTVKDAFANCLLCRACTANCVQGVRTDDVVVSFRHAYAERFGRGLLQRLVFRVLLPRPRLMGLLVRMIWAFRRTGLADAARRVGLVGMLNPKLARALELGAEKPGPLLRTRLAKRARGSADAQARPTVGYWMSCGYNYVLPEVGEATVRVLERMGYKVEVLDNCCCGAAAYGYGDLESAARLARENLRRVGDPERFEAIVSECGTCSGHLKDYPKLLADDPDWSGRAERLKSKVRSFSEFVVERGGLRASAAEGEEATAATVTFHDPCHLGPRYQNVVNQPRLILQSLPGVTFVEAQESDSCCGAAGTYAVTHPETSASILERKMGFINATGASIVATECPACMMQLRYGAERAGLPVSVLGISQLCDNATKPPPETAG